MNNSAILKALASHFTKNAESHRNHAACCTGLSECMKAAGIDFAKNAKKDFYTEAAAQHEADADRCEKIAAMCTKCATKGEDAEFVKAIVSSVMGAVDAKYGGMIVPDGGVRKVFQTPDPNAVNGLTLVGRPGQATPPTSLEGIDPSLRALVQE